MCVKQLPHNATLRSARSGLGFCQCASNLFEIFFKLPEVSRESAGEVERVPESFSKLDRCIGLRRVCRLNCFNLRLQGGLLCP